MVGALLLLDDDRRQRNAHLGGGGGQPFGDTGAQLVDEAGAAVDGKGGGEFFAVLSACASELAGKALRFEP